MSKQSWEIFHKFENSLLASEQVSHFENLQIFEGLYLQAKSMGVFTSIDPLEGLDTDIRLARVLNILSK